MLSWLLTVLLFLGQTATDSGPSAKTAGGAWKLEAQNTTDSFESASFLPLAPSLKGQANLIFARLWLAGEEENLAPSVVLGAMYDELKGFKLLGSKDSNWGGRSARLVSFKASLKERRVLGRMLMAQAGREAFVLLLTCNPQVQGSLEQEFEYLRERWNFSAPFMKNIVRS